MGSILIRGSWTAGGSNFRSRDGSDRWAVISTPLHSGHSVAAPEIRPGPLVSVMLGTGVAPVACN